MRASWLLVIVGCLALVATAVFGSVRGLGMTSEEAGPSTATSPGVHEVTNDLIAFYEARIERDPADFVSYTKLGGTYVRQARETGDIGAFERARASFEQALTLYANDVDARAGLATVLFALHDFRAALDLSRQVYDEDPGATSALATIADAHLALGEYDEAAGWYAKLDAEADGPAVDSRLAQLAYLTGDTDGAKMLMSRAVEVAEARGRRPESLAYYRTQLGELYFGTGDIDRAQGWYEQALAGFDGYHPALAGLGAVAAARGHDDEAIAYYERAVAVVPSPQYLAVLGDVYARAGDDVAAQHRYDTVEFIGRLAEINRTVYNRELTLFRADHGFDTALAVQQALSELDLRQDIYGYDALAWALYKDGRADEAQGYMEQALQLGTQDAKLFFHAGMIERALGNRAQARAHLERALDLSPHISVLYEQDAQEALAALDRSDDLAER